MKRGWCTVIPFALLLAGCVAAPDPVTSDPVSFDERFPAAMAALPIPSAGTPMLARAYLPQGAGPHPLVILVHGLPGNELNLDLAQAMRRAGWAVLTFHYRGAWGSDGSFGFASAIDDVAAAIAYARSADAAQRLRTDGGRIVLVGHSMGSFTALQAAARDPGVKAVAAIAPWSPLLAAAAAARDADTRRQVEAALQATTRPLKGASGASLTEEAMRRAADWQPERLAAPLAGRSVLLVGAARDTVAPLQDHVVPLAAALRAGTNVRVTEVTLDSDHALSERRIALARVLIAWLNGQR